MQTNTNLLLSEYLVVPYIRQAGFAVRNPWELGQRRLLDYLLVYNQEGQFVITADGEEYVFKEQEFCLIQPGILITLEGRSRTITPFAHLDFFYNPNREASFPTMAGQVDLSEYAHLMQPILNNVLNCKIPIIIKPSQPMLFRDMFLRMIDIWEQQGSFHQLQTQQIATSLFLDLIKTYMKEERRPMNPLQMLNWVTSYISFNLSEPLTVQDMARHSMLSTSRFNAVFRENFGISPYQYLIRLRVQRAEELLKSGNLTLDEISSFCGFANIHHFSRVFKKKTGQSPGAFRKQLLKETL